MNDANSIGNQLDHTGINLHAVFDLVSLPQEIRTELEALYPDLSDYRQLLLFGHGGRSLWEAIPSNPALSDHPIDDYSVEVVTEFCNQNSMISEFKMIYPGQKPIGLQSLGELAGWHHTSPFRVGVNRRWGSWFAYRVAILSDSQFENTTKEEVASPCVTCTEKPCISACPAKALDNEYSLSLCLDYRKEHDSLCKNRCLARMACPIAKVHQYDIEQIKYHYGVSMKMIERREL